MFLNNKQVVDYEIAVDGIDSYFQEAYYLDGTPLTDLELDLLGKTYEDALVSQCFKTRGCYE